MLRQGGWVVGRGSSLTGVPRGSISPGCRAFVHFADGAARPFAPTHPIVHPPVQTSFYIFNFFFCLRADKIWITEQPKFVFIWMFFWIFLFFCFYFHFVLFAPTNSISEKMTSNLIFPPLSMPSESISWLELQVLSHAIIRPRTFGSHYDYLLSFVPIYIRPRSRQCLWSGSSRSFAIVFPRLDKVHSVVPLTSKTTAIIKLLCYYSSSNMRGRKFSLSNEILPHSWRSGATPLWWLLAFSYLLQINYNELLDRSKNVRTSSQ